MGIGPSRILSLLSDSVKPAELGVVRRLVLVNLNGYAGHDVATIGNLVQSHNTAAMRLTRTIVTGRTHYKL